MTNNYNKNLYKILNVECDASEAEIKASYRKLVRLYHPDVAGVNADEEKFKEIQAAYEVLSDTEQRQKYDVLHGFYKEKLKKEFDKKKEKENFQFNEYIKNAKTKTKQKTYKNEEKNSFSKSINEAFDNLFHAQNRQFEGKKEKREKTAAHNLQPVNGADIQTEITVSVMEAIEGTSRKVNILHTEPCAYCEGRKFISGVPCSVCNSTGQIQNQKKISVKIPKGVKNGAKIRVKKEGNKGQNGGKDGDLYLIVNITKGKYIDTDGSDIFITLPVTPWEAALGTSVRINILKEPVTVKIPPLTSSGQKLRLTELGIENKSKRGDVIITVLIKMPETLSEKEKSLYEQLKDCTSFDVRKDFKNGK